MTTLLPAAVPQSELCLVDIPTYPVSTGSLDMANLRRAALKNLRQLGSPPFTHEQLGRAVLQALVQEGVDLRSGPGLEEMKQLLVDVLRTSSRWEAMGVLERA
jgi:hypothetical protein